MISQFDKKLWYLTGVMQLVLQTQKMGNVAVIRCKGRLVTGEEVRALQQEFEKLAPAWKQIVLHMAEVNFIDSGGLGALVRVFGVLQNTGGHLRLCEVSPFVLQVLKATNLDRVFHLYVSETEAVGASAMRGPHTEDTSRVSRTSVVCIDTSSDLLAYVRVLLQRSGYDVFTTRHPTDASIFIRVAKPSVVIFGPGIQSNSSAIEDFRISISNIPLLTLPSDFATTEASQAGMDLVNRIQSLLNDQQ